MEIKIGSNQVIFIDSVIMVIGETGCRDVRKRQTILVYCQYPTCITYSCSFLFLGRETRDRQKIPFLVKHYFYEATKVRSRYTDSSLIQYTFK